MTDNRGKGHSNKDHDEDPTTSRQNTLVQAGLHPTNRVVSRAGLRVAINEKPFVHPHMQSRNTAQRRLGVRGGHLQGRGVSPDSRNKNNAEQLAAKE